MDRKSPGAGKRQVNLRLAGEAVEVLEAIAFLDHKSSVQEVVSEVVRSYVESRSREDEVQTVMRTRAEYDGKRTGKVRQIADRVRTSGKDEGDG